ncbi:EthD family reductase [Mycolicibacterium phocaicum]|uniref:EthD family reductase n=1 Tax=Mycolicibacterium phocaicum TaxID=319706 RepID=A0A7I7ZV58_9MYCO|nr:EthD family reductase [Mycolicibacterium phocaicum]TLH64012.1 EthD family reductase [Mycolicibacterium phocaicum]BBZ58128.1 ethyl tert-butyl ether degradation protein EthD [Mycolicibacterium phocaicum]
MYRVLISYGHPDDPSAFDNYYANTHLPLAAQIPGVTHFAAGRCESFDGTTPSSYMLADIGFATREDAHAGLSSPQGQAAAADIANFATGGATMAFRNDDFSTP